MRIKSLIFNQFTTCSIRESNEAFLILLLRSSNTLIITLIPKKQKIKERLIESYTECNWNED